MVMLYCSMLPEIQLTRLIKKSVAKVVNRIEVMLYYSYFIYTVEKNFILFYDVKSIIMMFFAYRRTL
ncbi:MAG: hypothetical protein ACYDIA_22380 [Candidatus Humimicrobiaceae bacterium]